MEGLPPGPWEVGEPREPRPDDLPEPLEEFAPIYEGMGALGWAPSEVDLMDIFLVARFLGAGDRDPVIRGSRGLTLPKDDTGSPAKKRKDGSLAARIRHQQALDAQQALDLED